MPGHEDKQEANMTSPRSSLFPYSPKLCSLSHGLMKEIVDNSDDGMREMNLKASIPTYDDPASLALRRLQFDSLGRPHRLTPSTEHPTKRLRLRPVSCPVASFIS